MATITQSDGLRLQNRSRVLLCLRNNSQSRTSLSELTGLSSATVTQVTADLIDDGVIQIISPSEGKTEPEHSNARRGRPQVVLGMRAAAATSAVVTLLLNLLEVTLFDYAGEQLHQQSKHFITSKLSEKTLSSRLVQLIDNTLATNTSYRHTLKHIAVIYQGTVSSDNSRLLRSPITNVKDFDLAALLKVQYQVDVSVLNDSKMIANALYRDKQRSNGRTTPDKENFAALRLSYGIGLGLFHQGTVLTGLHSSGTEFGHLLLEPDGALCRCGRRGCIEAYASDYAIWRNAMQQPDTTAPIDEINADDFNQLIEQANQSDGPEREAFAKAGAAIGLGLTNLFALFDPFPVVLVGTGAAAFSLMEQSLYKNLTHYGASENQELISVYKSKSEHALILEGALMLTLAYIDHEIFSFGDRANSVPA